VAGAASVKLASRELSQNNSLATAKSPISAKIPKPTLNTITSHIAKTLSAVVVSTYKKGNAAQFS
jgi:hypothetical protein